MLHRLLRLSSLFILLAAALSAQTGAKVVPGPAGAPAAKSEATPTTDIPVEPVLTLVEKFDHHGTHRLDASERREARDYIAHLPEKPPAPINRTGLMRPPPVSLEPVGPGAKVAMSSIPPAAPAPFYDAKTIHTVFLDFPDTDWEQELTEFARTDVLIPARLTIDGQTFEEVGVHFRGPDAALGYKHSLQLTLNYANPEQTLGGQHQLELRAPEGDATFVRSLLYRQIVGDYLFTPAANYARVVLNGESWGIYLNTQPFDELFVQTHFGTKVGARWTTISGATLAYLGSDPAAYRAVYQLQTPEDPAAWVALSHLTQVLNQTPPDKLEAALSPLLDVDGALRYLALENTLVNQDGYWNRGGGYGLYLDPAGRFHLIPHEAGTVLQYQQVGEVSAGGGDRSNSSGGGRREGGQRREGGSERNGNDKGGGKKKPGEKDDSPEESAAVKAYQRAREYPKQATTDLAMILSYSFVNKADRHDDRKLTRDELLDFIRSWYIIMDEDSAGMISRPQFIAKFRNFIAPPSLRDGRTRQTFGKEDAPALVGGDLFDAMDKDHDGQLTREEFMGAFDAWFTAWCDPKTKLLTEEGIYQGLGKVLPHTVFAADQSYIDQKNFAVQNDTPADSNRGGRGGGRRGGSGSGNGGTGASIGIPGLSLPVSLGGKGGDGGNNVSAPAVTYRNEVLTPLHGAGLQTRPLLAKLLAVPALRDRYLTDIYEIIEKWMQWSVLGPMAKDYQGLIAADVKQETHKPTSYALFVQQIDQDAALSTSGDDLQSLKTFVTKRHDYLLDDPGLHRAIGAR